MATVVAAITSFLVTMEMQPLYSHSAGGCSSKNLLLNFDILMLLGDTMGNY